MFGARLGHKMCFVRKRDAFKKCGTSAQIMNKCEERNICLALECVARTKNESSTTTARSARSTTSSQRESWGERQQEEKRRRWAWVRRRSLDESAVSRERATLEDT